MSKHYIDAPLGLMNLNSFSRYYGLTLLPVSHSQISLGDLVWKPLWGKPKLEHSGMPNHILNAFYDANLLDIKTHERALKKIRKQKQYPAQLSERNITTNTEQAIAYSSYGMERLSQKFAFNKIRQYEFENIQVRLLSNELRISIDGYLEQLKKENWKAYQGNINRVYMITELYYGDLKIQIDTDLKKEFMAALKETDLELKSALDYEKTSLYSFSNHEIPFAIRLERVKKFNG